MSFFKSEKAKPKIVQFPEQKTSRKWLQSLYQAEIPNFPTQQIAGMSGTEQQGQSLLSQYLNAGPNADFTTAMDQYRKTAMGGYDPMTSPAFQGYRDASAMEEEGAVNKVAGRATAAGLYGSTPALTGEGMTRRGYSADRMSYLGQLLNQERDRQLSATGSLLTGAEYQSQDPLRKATAASTLGALPRELEQQQNEATFNAIMQELMFPYNVQAPIAQSIMTNNPSYYMKEGGPSEWDTIKSVGGDFAKIFAAMG